MTDILKLQPATDAGAIPLMLTTDETASVLRVAPKTLRNWVKDWGVRRHGPEPVKVGGRRLYRRSDVLAFAGLKDAA